MLLHLATGSIRDLIPIIAKDSTTIKEENGKTPLIPIITKTNPNTTISRMKGINHQVVTRMKNIVGAISISTPLEKIIKKEKIQIIIRKSIIKAIRIQIGKNHP